ncbi:MAG: ATP-binding cassette domain-containing protein [Pleurocapsa sp.]
MSDRPSGLILRLEQVSLAASIGSAWLLQNISFEVNRGDKLAIIGASGAGKTSLLKLLNRLNNPTQGKIYFKTTAITQIPVISLRQQIVLVPQEPKLLGMSVRQALVYPLQLQALPTTEINRRLNIWLEQLRIPEAWLERYELQLSFGQRQLIAIARGLMMQPQILLLDEPTSALDLGTANHLLTFLDRLIRESNLTIVMVNHQLELIKNFADRLIYLTAGQLEVDTPNTNIAWEQLRQKLLTAKTQSDSEWE